MEKCNLNQHGFVGEYYQGNSKDDRAIISVGGASCNKKTSRFMAKHLIDSGFNVLVLSFYYWGGLSKELASVPVDYCEKAVKWLRKEKGIKKVGMTGPSTGGGYTLLCASLIPEITAICPVVPFDYVIEGTTKNNKRKYCSVYTFHGKDVPYTPSELLDMGMKEWLKRAKQAKGYGVKRFMRYGYDQLTPFLTEESRIKIENAHASILLFAAKNDDCWPSDEAVPRIVKSLKEKNYNYSVDFVIYEKGSHCLPTNMGSGLMKLLVKLMIPSEKKYPDECDKARVDCQKRMIEFFREF